MSKKRSVNGYVVGLMKTRPLSYIFVREWEQKGKAERLLWDLNRKKPLSCKIPFLLTGTRLKVRASSRRLILFFSGKL